MKKIIIIILILFTLCCTAEIPDFKQDDKQWANYTYSSHGDSKQNIKYNGCAITVAADMINYWFDDTVTPIDMAILSMQKFKSCAYNGGTNPYFWSALAQEYDFLKFQKTIYIENAIQCLNDGGLVIVSFTSGIWCPVKGSAHICIIYSYSEEDGFRMHDPAGPDIIYGHGRYEKVAAAAYVFYCYWK